MKKYQTGFVWAVILAAVLSGVIIAHSSGDTGLRRNQAATREYLRLRRRFIAATKIGSAAGASMAAVVGHARISCKKVLAGALHEVSPSMRPGVEMGLFGEMYEVLEIAAQQSQGASTVAFAAALRQIRWSNTDVTRLAYAFAHYEAQRSRRLVPNLCTEMRTWVASDYRALPKDTTGPAEAQALRAFGERAATLHCGGVLGPPQETMLAVLQRFDRSGIPSFQHIAMLELRRERTEGGQILKYVLELEYVLGLRSREASIIPSKSRHVAHEWHPRLPRCVSGTITTRPARRVLGGRRRQRRVLATH